MPHSIVGQAPRPLRGPRHNVGEDPRAARSSGRAGWGASPQPASPPPARRRCPGSPTAALNAIESVTVNDVEAEGTNACASFKGPATITDSTFRQVAPPPPQNYVCLNLAGSGSTLDRSTIDTNAAALFVTGGDDHIV